MPPFTTLDEVRMYAHLNVPRNTGPVNYTYKEDAHNSVFLLCSDSSMTMLLLFKILYRFVYKVPYTVEPSARLVYAEYLQAMQLGKKHDAL